MIRQTLRRILRPQRTVPPRDQRWDSTVEEVYELPDVLRGVTPAPPAGQVPDVDGPPALVAATTGTGDPERGYQPRHASDETATSSPAYIGRHTHALREPTREFRARIEWETGQPLTSVGPRERDLRPTVWAQPELIEVVP